MKQKIRIISMVIASLLLFASCSNSTDGNNTSSSTSSDINSDINSDVNRDIKRNDSNNMPYQDEINSLPGDNMPPYDMEESVPTSARIDTDMVNAGEFEAYDNVKKSFGQGRIVNSENRPVTCDEYQEKYKEYETYFIMPNDEKTIYLTFDQGYENGYTIPILDTLKEKNISAVFFVTGQYAQKNPELINRMINEGHIIGNHTDKHKHMPNISTQEVINDIVNLHNYMIDEYGYEMTLFRPPAGEFSEKSLAITKELGYKTYLWSFAYKDYDVNAQMGVDKAFPRVVDAAHSGAIYLLHSVSKDNAQMLGDVIDNLSSEGYEFGLLA